MTRCAFARGRLHAAFSRRDARVSERGYRIHRASPWYASYGRLSFLEHAASRGPSPRAPCPMDSRPISWAVRTERPVASVRVGGDVKTARPYTASPSRGPGRVGRARRLGGPTSGCRWGLRRMPGAKTTRLSPRNTSACAPVDPARTPGRSMPLGLVHRWRYNTSQEVTP